MKKIAYFANGVPDPTQGGSGIVNYYILKKLLEKKYLVDAYFRCKEDFLKNSVKIKFIKELKKKLNNINFIHEKKKNYKQFGYQLLSNIYSFKQCDKFVNGLKKKEYDAYIAFDLGWAYALRNKRNCLSILGDAYHLKEYYGVEKNFSSPFFYYRKFRAYTTSTYKTLSRIGSDLSKITLGSFARPEVEELNAKGVKCIELNAFSPKVKNCQVKSQFNNKVFNLLHIGDSRTSASRIGFKNLNKILIKLSTQIDFDIKITFLGRYTKKFISPRKNIFFNYLGHVDDLSPLINTFDASIYVADYPVGIRTRIITALSYGLPCIAHKSSSFALHKLKHGYDILFFNNYKDFIKNVLLLKKNKKLRINLSKRSRKSWLKYYDPDRNTDNILKIVNC